jgi:Ca2+/Na+ antiporter
MDEKIVDDKIAVNETETRQKKGSVPMGVYWIIVLLVLLVFVVILFFPMATEIIRKIIENQ